MMCPDNGAVDHVGASVPLDQLGQRFEHSLEHTGLDPSPISAKDAVPFAVFVGQLPPLRSGARHPHHALEIPSIVLRRAAAAPSFSRQKRTDQRPLIVRQANPFAHPHRPFDDPPLGRSFLAGAAEALQSSETSGRQKMAFGRDIYQGSRSVDVPLPRYRQRW